MANTLLRSAWRCFHADKKLATWTLSLASRPFHTGKSTMAADEARYKEEVFKILDRETTENHHHIHYEGYKANHLSHAVIALYLLKTPLEDLRRAVDWQKANKMEANAPFKDAEEKRQQEQDQQSPDPDQLLGKQGNYYRLYKHYTDLLKTTYANSPQKLLAGEFPKLSAGVIGAATHGLVHTGYGAASGRGWYVAEGLAFLHDIYLAPTYTKTWDLRTLGNGQEDIADVIMKIHNDTELIDFMNRTSNTKPGMGFSGESFYGRIAAVFGNRTDTLAQYVHSIKFPEGLGAGELTMDKVPRLCKWLVDSCITVYAISEKKNDFFLLHAVTSSWALSNILTCLSCPEDVLTSVWDFLVAIFMVYLIRDSPALDVGLLTKNDGLSQSWDELIRKAIHHTDAEREHMYKIVQVCKVMSDASPNDPMESIYRLAAQNIDRDFAY